jgi:endonuclease/exonuclease/phosphatase family metal-dependent hydrolase
VSHRPPGASPVSNGDRPFGPPPALSALVGLLTLVVLELMRSSGPLIDYAFAEAQVSGAAGAGLVTYLAPGLVVALLIVAARHRPVRALLIGVGVLVTLRLVSQGLTGVPKFYVGLTTVAVGVGVLLLAVVLLGGRPDGGRVVASPMAVGAGAGVGLQLALGTWDAYWRSTLLGWGVSLVMVAAVAVLALVTSKDHATAPHCGTRRLWALGPFLGLLLMVLANPAFAASQAGLPLALAGPVHGAGLLLAGWLVSQRPRPPTAVVALALPLSAAAVMGLGGVLPWDGWLVLLATLLAQVAAVVALAGALGPSGPTQKVLSLHLAGLALLVGLGAILPPMLYQITYEIPLGFPNEWVVIAAAGALGLSTVGASGRAAHAPPRFPLLPVGVALLLLGTTIALAGALDTNRQPTETAEDGSKVMLWNVHYAVDSTGALDPEAIARAVDRHDPDVVLLNEISSGWVLAGGMDLRTWLSQRLDRSIVFAPAADRQFGSAVLSHRKMSGVEVHRLPRGEGSQDRSAVSARVSLGGRPVDVVSVQLQNKAANAATRVLQARMLLDALDGREPLIVAGDLNANPGTAAVEVFTRAGLVSAVDEVGDPAVLTFPAAAPEQRLDWVLGRGVEFVAAEVDEAETSADHLPVLVSVAD